MIHHWLAYKDEADTFGLKPNNKFHFLYRYLLGDRWVFDSDAEADAYLKRRGLDQKSIMEYRAKVEGRS
jgi:hypothetical protein